MHQPSQYLSASTPDYLRGEYVGQAREALLGLVHVVQRDEGAGQAGGQRAEVEGGQVLGLVLLRVVVLRRVELSVCVRDVESIKRDERGGDVFIFLLSVIRGVVQLAQRTWRGGSEERRVVAPFLHRLIAPAQQQQLHDVPHGVGLLLLQRVSDSLVVQEAESESIRESAQGYYVKAWSAHLVT